MRVRKFQSAASLGRALARTVSQALEARPSLVLGLPTGRTPIPFYQELVRLHRQGLADFSRASTFNLDEFVGLAASDERSYHAFMRRHLFDHVNLAPGRAHFLDGAARSIVRECARYERAIARTGGIDLLILGLGPNGHIGFNEPATALQARSHRTRLTAGTRRLNAALFDRPDEVPREALSMGIATILSARHIVLVATGAAKAGCVRRMIEGPVTSWLPASFLQVHSNVQVWLDRAASADLE